MFLSNLLILGFKVPLWREWCALSVDIWAGISIGQAKGFRIFLRSMGDHLKNLGKRVMRSDIYDQQCLLAAEGR